MQGEYTPSPSEPPLLIEWIFKFPSIKRGWTRSGRGVLSLGNANYTNLTAYIYTLFSFKALNYAK